MAVLKTIEVSIVKGDTVLFLSSTSHSMAFPPEHVGQLMELVVEGFKLEDVDHDCLNELHLCGHCNFMFGPDFAYRVSARVTYPE